MVLRNTATPIVLSALRDGGCLHYPREQALIISVALLLELYMHLSYFLLHL